MTEQKFFIQVPVLNDKDKADDDTCTQVLQDIFDFFGRTEFYDIHEAARLKPLISEAEKGATFSRLKLIRSQIKVVFNKLREQRILTDMFKYIHRKGNYKQCQISQHPNGVASS